MAVVLFGFLVASVTLNVALLVDRRPDERGYRPHHTGRTPAVVVGDELDRAMRARRRELRRSPAPWAPPRRGVYDPIPVYPKET